LLIAILFLQLPAPNQAILVPPRINQFSLLRALLQAGCGFLIPCLCLCWAS
jgi:hypothetical protein